MRQLKLAREKIRILEPSREQFLTQTKNRFVRCGFRTAGSENLDRIFGLGCTPVVMLQSKIVDHPGQCQVCDKQIVELFVLGLERDSHCWCNLCVDCHKRDGIGLGLGRGEVYQLIDGEFQMLAGWVSCR